MGRETDERLTGQIFVKQTKMEEVSLTKTEQKLLAYLQLHRGRVITRQELLKNVWETWPHLNTRTVDIHISHLRRKLQLRDTIKTVFKVGYTFSAECFAILGENMHYAVVKLDSGSQR